ncbi:MAG TPA: glutamate racemase [Acidimicrobiia bacterium]|nr:glutamate racemase [Acidimicrobiia bacterium]
MAVMIGVFDSGVGGLTVLTEIRRLLPSADLLYLADQGRAPYGVRSLDEVAEMAEQASLWLLERGADMVTIACNTASAAALHSLRARHPAVRFVGMEPAVKPAAVRTATGVIGVVATAATFQGELFASVVQRHSLGATILTQACPGWVELVEAAITEGPTARKQVESCLTPILQGGADTLVLGCTHFGYLVPLIEEVAGPALAIIDPAPAVARQVERVAPSRGGEGKVLLATSGNTALFEKMAYALAGIEADEPVLACIWQ